jgi:hypothetical protein
MPLRCSVRWAARSGTGRGRADPGRHRWCSRCSVGSLAGPLTPLTGPLAPHRLMSSRCVVVGFRSRLWVISGAEVSIHPNNAGRQKKRPLPGTSGIPGSQGSPARQLALPSGCAGWQTARVGDYATRPSQCRYRAPSSTNGPFDNYDSRNHLRFGTGSQDPCP